VLKERWLSLVRRGMMLILIVLLLELGMRVFEFGGGIVVVLDLVFVVFEADVVVAERLGRI
jgi:hypothetical protein